MKGIQNNSQSIGERYPTTTGRLKRVTGTEPANSKKIALLGDSTIDNGFWVQTTSSYIDRTHTVTHQTALALAASAKNEQSYEIGNFAVDGATTADLRKYCRLNKVLPADQDHPLASVHQINAVANWQPDIAVLSVGGNNYREALFGVLRTNLTYFQLLFRITPEHARPIIKDAFSRVKDNLLAEYKAIIDDLIAKNSGLSRLVLLSQYYPEISETDVPYFIYTGFSHLARAEGRGQVPFAVIEETMNELYRGVLEYVATKNTEVVLVDVTSSLNPLGGNHTSQIEPNGHGAKVMGRLIAEAVEYSFPVYAAEDKKPISVLRMTPNELIQTEVLDEQSIQRFQVKPVGHFIRENRYSHVGLFFSPSTTLGARYGHGYALVMGKQFDTEFSGLFAFGLLDLSLITIMASYLWRVALNEQIHLSLRATAGVIAAPVLLSKMIIGLTLMVALALPIYGYDKAINAIHSSADKEEDVNLEQMAPAI